MAEAKAGSTEKKKRVVKKRPLVIVYKGENVEILNVTRDLEAVVQAMQDVPGVKLHKVVV